jgi:LmbE family N-acetylglucosaminyl deacetylase
MSNLNLPKLKSQYDNNGWVKVDKFFSKNEVLKINKKIYAFEVMSNSEWNLSNFNSAFQPNVIQVITKTINKKVNALKFYKNEMRKYPHARSLENVINLAKFRGASVGFKYAEAFTLLREIS